MASITKRRAGLAVTLAALALGAGLAGCASGSHGPRPMVMAPASCDDFTISIYFDEGSHAITPEAYPLLSAAHDRARGCTVKGVTVIGLADTPGGIEANLQLSKQRADAVTHALENHGFHALTFGVAAVGSQGAETPKGQSAPLRRRVDVTFHLADHAAP